MAKTTAVRAASSGVIVTPASTSAASPAATAKYEIALDRRSRGLRPSASTSFIGTGA